MYSATDTEVINLITFFRDNKDTIKDFVIPVLTFLITLISTLYIGSSQTKKQVDQFRTSLMSNYFSQLFDDLLVNRIPKAIQNVEFYEGRLADSFEDIVELFIELLDKALFYSLISNDFYSELERAIVRFEDTVVNISLQHNISLEQQELYKFRIKESAKEVYSVLYNHYTSTNI